MERKKKYTHIIEKAVRFLKIGVSLRLKQHSYTMSDAYWRLRDGKGLISSYDQETFKICSDLITQIRRYMGSPVALHRQDYNRIKSSKEDIIDILEFFRKKIENGVKPQYIYDNCEFKTANFALRELLREKSIELTEQTLDEVIADFWENLDEERMFKIIADKDAEIVEALEKYAALSEEEKIKCHGEPYDNVLFRFDSVWQIRTDYERKSSIEVNINKRLCFIWNIPVLTTDEHRILLGQMNYIVQNWKVEKEFFKKNKGDVSKYKVAETLSDAVNKIKDLLPIFKVGKSDINKVNVE